MHNAALTAGVFTGRPPLRYLLTLSATGLALTGCVLGRRPATTPTGPIYASAIPAASPTALSVGTPRPRPTQGPCINDAEFIADQTIPDGTQVTPGETLDKRWLVRNTGTCDWGPGYTLLHVSGPPMGADTQSGLYPARAGAEIEIQLTLTAPDDPGEHTTAWRMQDDHGQVFGDVLFITIVVSEAQQP